MKGPIAIFDILGYQSFLEKNADLNEAAKIIDLISSAPNILVEGWVANQPRMKDVVEQMKRCFHVLVFSDTIVCGFEFGVLDEKQHDTAWAFMTFYARALYEILFSHGLPVRGCIHYGDFLIRKGCIAGSAVVSAYKTLSEIDMAAVIITPEASDEMQRLASTVKTLKILSSEMTPIYLCAMKGGKEKEYRVVDVLPVSLRELRIDREYEVRRVFWMLNKNIPDSAEVKVAKTKKLFDYLVFHSQQLEERGSRVFGRDHNKEPTPKVDPKEGENERREGVVS